MTREIVIGRTVYLANDESRTLLFLRKLPLWELFKKNNGDQNMWSVNGYVRIFSDGTKQIFIRSEYF